MTNERVIRGTITRYTQIKSGFKSDGKTPYASVGFKLDTGSEYHNIFAGNKSEIEEIQMVQPIGSEIEFIEFNNGKYWNIKPGSIKLHKVGDGVYRSENGQPAPPAPSSPTTRKPTKNNTENGMTAQDWLDKEIRGHRSQALKNATALACQGVIKRDEINGVAQSMVDFIMGVDDDQEKQKSDSIQPVSSQPQQPSSVDANVQEEYVE